MKGIILASASPRRAELLRQIGLSFDIIPSDSDETIDIELKPEEVVQQLAYMKAESIAKDLKVKNRTGRLIIGADTIVVKDRILGKPLDENDAFHMLKSLKGHWHEVLTGVSLIDSESLETVNFYEKTRVKMRSYTEGEIYSYIRTGEPMDKAGSYGIQGCGAVLVERIEGCYFNVVGLPLSRLSTYLGRFGIDVLKA